MGGKRYANTPKESDWDRKINYKKVFIIIGIIIAIIALVAGCIFGIKYIKTRKTKQVVNTTEVEENKMPKTYERYDVLGELVIEKIDLKTYILDSTENDAMDKAPVKLFGKKLNEEGNFCIAGHNYDEIFAKLIDLDIGDEFYIEDIDGIIQDYVITEILEVEPTDLTPLLPAENKIEVTLITCEEEAIQRLVIKAERIDIEADETEENVDTNTVTDEV